MTPQTLLTWLEETAEKAGIRVRYEQLDLDEAVVRNGLCTIKGERTLFIHKSHSPAEKIRILAEALKRVDLTGVYLKPAVRELIDPDDEMDG